MDTDADADSNDCSSYNLPLKVLDYHKEIVTSFLGGSDPTAADACDGLIVMAKGLGLHRIIQAFLFLHADAKNLVLLINTPPRELELLKSDLDAMHAKCQSRLDDETEGDAFRTDLFKIITNETNAEARAEIYRLGGVLAITSRILVVDMLLGKVPMNLVTGIMVNHAHRVSEFTSEAFILRIFRDQNKIGFIRAFSDSPDSFVHGFNKLEKTLKWLYLRKLYIWPRFHMTVSSALSVSPINVIELRVPLSQSMKEIQAAIVDCIDGCLVELRRSMPHIDVEDVTVENALFKNFDAILRHQLDPIWHKCSSKTKALVGDLKTLRRLLGYLLSYDCITFNTFLETILTSISALSGTNSYFKQVEIAPWLNLDAAQTVIQLARSRVYLRVPTTAQPSISLPAIEGIPAGIDPVLERPPKWSVLQDTLLEIDKERKALDDAGEDIGPVLIMCEGDRTSYQIREFLATIQRIKAFSKPNSRKRKAVVAIIGDNGDKIDGHVVKVEAGEDDDNNDDDDDEEVETASSQMLTRLLKNYFRWKGGLKNVTKTTPSTPSLSTDASRNNIQTSSRGGWAGRGAAGAPSNKRRRARGGGSVGPTSDTRDVSMLQTEVEEVAQFLDTLPESDLEVESTILESLASTDIPGEIPHMGDVVVVRPYSTSSASTSSSGSSVSNGDDDSRCLEDINPRWIIMYDPDVGFVRRLEVFKALNPELKSTVYFMVYDSSVEEQKYLSAIRKEKDAFGALIRQKSIMAVPLDQDGRLLPDADALFWSNLDTRTAGGQYIPASATNLVVTDVREFRSAVPCILHAKSLRVLPCTLEVGDYILSPDICVERKSISDLIGSFKSGRLYTQAENMCLHYKTPILLIEFDQNKAFSLQLTTDLKSDISFNDIQSKLVMLAIAFPKLRVIWSSSPHATADIFLDLKKTQPEPSIEVSISIGADLNPSSISQSLYATTPQDFLRALPGITSKNYKHVMNSVESIKALSGMPLADLEKILGPEAARALFEFLRVNKRK